MVNGSMPERTSLCPFSLGALACLGVDCAANGGDGFFNAALHRHWIGSGGDSSNFLLVPPLEALMSFDTIIRNGSVVTATDTYPADIAIANGKIAAIGKDLPTQNSGGREMDFATQVTVPMAISQW